MEPPPPAPPDEVDGPPTPPPPPPTEEPEEDDAPPPPPPPADEGNTPPPPPATLSESVSALLLRIDSSEEARLRHASEEAPVRTYSKSLSSSPRNRARNASGKDRVSIGAPPVPEE